MGLNVPRGTVQRKPFVLGWAARGVVRAGCGIGFVLVLVLVVVHVLGAIFTGRGEHEHEEAAKPSPMLNRTRLRAPAWKSPLRGCKNDFRSTPKLPMLPPRSPDQTPTPDEQLVLT